jgi:hypothetical protein
MRGDDVQVITQYARTENAHCEEVTAQISIAAKNASDCLVAVFFCVTSTGERVRSVICGAQMAYRFLRRCSTL